MVYLEKCPVPLGNDKSRPGYRDTRGQVYLPPISSKRIGAWERMMRARGFAVPQSQGGKR